MLKNEEMRNLQFCHPLPNGTWDCSGGIQGYNDNAEETWTTQPSPKPKPTSIPSTSPTKVPTFSPSTRPTKAPPPVCKLRWNDNSDCRSSLTAKMTAEERRIYAGEYMCSPNKRYFFGMTMDFHLAICDGDTMVWEEGPFIDRNPHIVFKTNGDLQVQNRRSQEADDWKVMWSSETIGSAQSTLSIDDVGNIQITNTYGEIEWDAKPIGTVAPTYSKTPSLSPSISQQPTISRSPVGSETYFPGELFDHDDTGLQLSVGLSARLIAKTGKNVQYSNGLRSRTKFHDQPDAGGCFPAKDGGWYYLSNSELGADEDATGGVGRIRFNSNGDVVEYQMVLTGTRMNCGSGVTPWNTYISCEEYRGVAGSLTSKPGQCWEVHPENIWKPRPTKMGGEGGKFESVAFDDREMSKLKGFVTTDAPTGALYRFSPHPMIITSAMISGDYSNVLHFDGEIDYLVLNPATKTFRWSSSKEEGEESAELYFGNSEGIDVHNGMLYFTAKKIKTLFILNLDTYEYTSSSTLSGAFNGQPDQIVRLLPNNDEDEDGLLYFLEDGGNNPAGVFARDKSGKQYLTILIGGRDNSDESTGLAFCDNGRRMMIAFQDEGELYEITREDGKPFHGNTVDIKYHAVMKDEL